MRWAGPAWATVILLIASPSHAYEFWLRAQTTGQAYQLRGYRLVGPDLFLGRRLITQTLALRIFDVGDFAANRRLAHMPDRGLRISWHSYLRIDHDFGSFTSGRITLPGPVQRDAIDVIPELADSSAALDLMYGFLELEGLLDNRVALQVGRVLTDDGWGASALDGARGRVDLDVPVSVSAFAGFRVRASSPLGVSAYELNGTSGAGCREYVEGPTPGTGSWQLIDRNREIQNHALSSDYEYCPQRDALQPSIGFAIATRPRNHWGAELGYRRTWSRTVGLIGPVDRLDHPDLGLYPNDFGQAPSSGVDEERVYARVHGKFATPHVAIEPYGDVRFSLLHAVVDRAEAGVRLRHDGHVLEPSISSFFPTFDGDSIFNAFSIEPTTDFRLSYRFDAMALWRGSAEAWLRRYSHDDSAPAFAAGGEAAIERALGRGVRGRLDALWDDGWGGRRVGGTAQAAWKGNETLWLRGRLIVLEVAPDSGSRRNTASYVTSSAMASTTWRVADAVAFHTVLEADRDAIRGFQTRAIVIFDLGFAPEP